MGVGGGGWMDESAGGLGRWMCAGYGLWSGVGWVTFFDDLGEEGGRKGYGLWSGVWGLVGWGWHDLL